MAGKIGKRVGSMKNNRRFCTSSRTRSMKGTLLHHYSSIVTLRSIIVQHYGNTPITVKVHSTCVLHQVYVIPLSLGGLWGSWGLLGDVLGASWWAFGKFWGSFVDPGGKIGVEHRHGRFPFFGRAVLEASWGRFSGFWRSFWSRF